jgi:cytochrome c5
MLRYFFLLFGFAVVVVVVMAGFRGQKSARPPIELFPDMDRQPKVKAQVASGFFADGRATRQPVSGTVPLGYAMPLHKPEYGSTGEMSGPYKQIAFGSGPDYFNTGKMGDQWGTGMPFGITPAVLERGKDRFTITCSVCHGATGAGDGITSKYGLVGIASLLQTRIVEMADGEIFNTITHGKNTMMAYGYNIQTPDRWAIIAYVRALQRAQNATMDDVPEPERAALLAQ